jgi:hypothetical protein
MQVLSKLPLQVKPEGTIGICATANLEGCTRLLKINDNRTRELIAWDFGQLSLAFTERHRKTFVRS